MSSPKPDEDDDDSDVEEVSDDDDDDVAVPPAQDVAKTPVADGKPPLPPGSGDPAAAFGNLPTLPGPASGRISRDGSRRNSFSQKPLRQLGDPREFAAFDDAPALPNNNSKDSNNSVPNTGGSETASLPTSNTTPQLKKKLIKPILKKLTKPAKSHRNALFLSKFRSHFNFYTENIFVLGCRALPAVNLR